MDNAGFWIPGDVGVNLEQGRVFCAEGKHAYPALVRLMCFTYEHALNPMLQALRPEGIDTTWVSMMNCAKATNSCRGLSDFSAIETFLCPRPLQRGDQETTLIY
eukprot:GHVR01068178.1.p2 GENE.GHVR01068178.1~~GHVR01068178.1.p2  ORF type:complete len:104 (-),score=8.81 GHVR01068178.1:732-1043(-)